MVDWDLLIEELTTEELYDEVLEQMERGFLVPVDVIVRLERAGYLVD